MASSLVSWGLPPERLILGDDEAHVWRAALEPSQASIQRLHQTLTADERARAERFRFQKDREHFIVARGTLRAILSRYLNKAPGQLRFRYSPYGKPILATACRVGSEDDGVKSATETQRRKENNAFSPCLCDRGARAAFPSELVTPHSELRRETIEGQRLRFNLAHSHGLVLYAVTRGREVGVDLEYIRREPNLLEGVEQFFAPREIAKLRALPASLRYEAFFACWTRKEAYLKARGDGLSIPLDQFEVSLAPTEPAALLHTQWDAQEAQRWSLRELTPGPGYVAALAVEGQTPAEGGVWRLKCWQWAD